MIIYGLDWCYEGSDDYYHLGYITRENWRSPELIIRPFSSAGDDPDGSLECGAQVDGLQARYIGMFTVVNTSE